MTCASDDCTTNTTFSLTLTSVSICLVLSLISGLDNRIFDVLSSLQSYLSDNPLPDLQPTREDEIGEKEDTSQTESDRILMARVIFWTRELLSVLIRRGDMMPAIRLEKTLHYLPSLPARSPQSSLQEERLCSLVSRT